MLQKSIDIIVMLVGLVLLLTEDLIDQPRIQLLVSSLGISLLTAGIVSLILHNFKVKPRPVAGMRILATSRNELKQAFKNQKYTAKKIDLLGITLGEALNEMVSDSTNRMLKRVMFERVRLRMILIHPKAPFLVQRAQDDGIEHDALLDNQRESVRNALKIYTRLLKLYKDGSKRDLRNIGEEFVIKLVDVCPYFTIDRIDDTIRWGLYTSASAGLQSPMFGVTDNLLFPEHHAIFDRIKQHWYNLLNGRLLYCEGTGELVRYIPGTVPYLNRDLADSILTKAEVDQILSKTW